MIHTNIENQTLHVNTESARHPEIQDTECQASGNPHAFDTGYAMAYGVDEAIMIRNFQYFIGGNATRGHNFREERFWTYDKLEDFPNHFPYWSVKQVRRILASLIKQGVIIKGEFNDHWSNRKQWYAFRDQVKFLKGIKFHKAPSFINPDLPKRANGKCPNGQMTNDQTGNCLYTTTITTTISPSTSLKVSDETETAKAVEVENTPSSEKPKRVKSEFSPRVREVANKLLQIVVDDSPSYIIPKKLTSLLQEVHYMLNDDKRDPEVLYAVLRSGLADPYNGPPLVNGNLGKKLREKFVTLEKKMNMNSKPPEVKRDRKFAPCSNDQKAIAIMEEMDKRAI